MTPRVEDIRIRHDLAPGDLGYVMYLHGTYYRGTHGYGIEFESYVALAVHEFYRSYDPALDQAWICEHGDRIVGSLLLMHRGAGIAQLRLFLLLPGYRGIGLGKHLMQRFLACLRDRGYRGAYLWTTEEQQTAVVLYERSGFQFTEEKHSTAFGKPLRELRYDLVLD